MYSAPSPEAIRLVESATELAPIVSRLRDEIERERRLPTGLVETLRKLGFFSLWLARDFGGPELSLTDFVRVIEALARHDGLGPAPATACVSGTKRSATL